MEKIEISLGDYAFFTFEVQTVKDVKNKCVMRILSEKCENGKLEVIAPIKYNEIGVSFHVQDAMHQIEVELVNYDVDMSISGLYNINEYEFSAFIEDELNEKIGERLMKNLKPASNDEDEVINAVQCIDIL